MGVMRMRELIEYTVRALVDKPEEVVVRQIAGPHSSIIQVRVAKEDIGKVIGKQGRIADALRTILSAASAKEKRRCILEILD
jgi:predicted RNA-binding protein YlqC (UPF0109 family)